MSVIANADYDYYTTNDKRKDLKQILQFVRNWRPENYTNPDSHSYDEVKKFEQKLIFTMQTWNCKYYPDIESYIKTERGRDFDFITPFYNFVQSLDYVEDSQKRAFFIQYFPTMYSMVYEYMYVWTKYEPEEEAMAIINASCFDDKLTAEFDDSLKEKCFQKIIYLVKKWVIDNVNLENPIFREGYKGDKVSIAYILDKHFSNLMAEWNEESDESIIKFSEKQHQLDFITPLFEYVDSLDDEFDELKQSIGVSIDKIFNMVLEYVYEWQGFISEEEAYNRAHDYFCGYRNMQMIPSNVYMAEHQIALLDDAPIE